MSTESGAMWSRPVKWRNNVTLSSPLISNVDTRLMTHLIHFYCQHHKRKWNNSFPLSVEELCVLTKRNTCRVIIHCYLHFENEGKYFGHDFSLDVFRRWCFFPDSPQFVKINFHDTCERGFSGNISWSTDVPKLVLWDPGHGTRNAREVFVFK